MSEAQRDTLRSYLLINCSFSRFHTISHAARILSHANSMLMPRTLFTRRHDFHTPFLHLPDNARNNYIIPTSHNIIPYN